MSRIFVTEECLSAVNIDRVERITIQNRQTPPDRDHYYLEARLIGGATIPLLDLTVRDTMIGGKQHTAVMHTAARLLSGEYETGSAVFMGAILDVDAFWDAVDYENSKNKEKK